MYPGRKTFGLTTWTLTHSRSRAVGRRRTFNGAPVSREAILFAAGPRSAYTFAEATRTTAVATLDSTGTGRAARVAATSTKIAQTATPTAIMRNLRPSSFILTFRGALGDGDMGTSEIGR